MKRYIFQVILLAVIFLLCWFGYNQYVKMSNEITRLKTNQNVLATGHTANEKTFTRAEFEAYQKYADSLANSKGIKTKQIVKYVKITEKFTDTVYIALFDSVGQEDIHTFSYNNSCLSAFGIIQNDSLQLSYEYNNDLHLFHYWKHKESPFIKRLFHWQFGKTYSAICISNCTGDTLKIDENINVIKK